MVSVAARRLGDVEMLLIFLGLVLVVFVAIGFARRKTERAQMVDEQADARRLIERLGGQVYNLTGSDTASQQALADAGERLNAAGSQIQQATTVAQARMAKQTALEGLYYVQAARTAMGLDPGPPIPEMAGQRTAGQVTEGRTIDYQGRQVQASPSPTPQTPNYYPGGMVAGRPVPAGWYSEPWWKTALVAGAWGVGSALLFDSLFGGMAGVAYGAPGFEGGFGYGGYDQGFGGGYYDGGGYDGGGFGDGSFGDGGGFDGGGFDGGGFDGGGFDGGF